jgi:hypothetical protein
MARTPSPPKDDSADEAGAEQEKAPVAKADAGSARTKRLVTGAAIGIGSAALVAALLYANRSRKPDKS